MTQDDERSLLRKASQKAGEAMTAAGAARSTAAGANNAANAANTKATDAEARAAAAKADADAARAAALQGAVSWISDEAITYSGLLALNLAPKTVTFNVAGAKVGDRIYVHRRGRPTLAGVNVVAGISLESTGFVPADGKVEVYHTIPAVGVGQTLLIPIKLIGYRPAVL